MAGFEWLQAEQQNKEDRTDRDRWGTIWRHTHTHNDRDTLRSKSNTPSPGSHKTSAANLIDNPHTGSLVKK